MYYTVIIIVFFTICGSFGQEPPGGTERYYDEVPQFGGRRPGGQRDQMYQRPGPERPQPESGPYQGPSPQQTRHPFQREPERPLFYEDEDDVTQFGRPEMSTRKKFDMKNSPDEPPKFGGAQPELNEPNPEATEFPPEGTEPEPKATEPQTEPTETPPELSEPETQPETQPESADAQTGKSTAQPLSIELQTESPEAQPETVERNLETAKSQAPDAADTEVTTEAEELSTVICETCSCADGVVDCNQKGLRTSFSKDDWNGLKNLAIAEVYMNKNNIHSLTLFPKLSIKVLSVSESKIEEVDDACFINLLELEDLDLSRNNIGTLQRKALWGPIMADHNFVTFAKMKRLNLAYNELHTLPKDAFAFMQSLVFLDLSGNPLRVIDQLVMGCLTDLTYLKELKLSGCELETLPDGLLRRQNRLTRLDISYNKFKVVPDALAEAVRLVYLNFDGNPIMVLSEETSISRLSKLKELSLCGHSRLQKIGANALGGLESLSVLRVCNNPRLSYLDDDFLTWYDDGDVEMRPLLKEMYLNNNNLTEIDSDFLFRWDQLQQMDFSDNPFICDCNNQWMVDVLVPFIYSNNGTAVDMICNKPQELRGVSFAQLRQDSKTLTCPAQDLTDQAVPDTAIVLGVVIGFFVTFPLVLILVLLWKRGFFAKCRESADSDSEDEAGKL